MGGGGTGQHPGVPPPPCARAPGAGTHSEFSERSPWKASGAISEIWLLLRSLKPKGTRWPHPIFLSPHIPILLLGFSQQWPVGFGVLGGRGARLHPPQLLVGGEGAGGDGLDAVELQASAIGKRRGEGCGAG